MSTLNWSDLIKEAGETGTYDALPDGDYDLVVLEATAKVSQSGKTMFAIKTQVEGGAHNKRLVWDNLVVSPDSQAALGIFFKKMHALGLPREYFMQQPQPTNAQIEQALVGRKFRGQIGSRTYNGNKKNEIKNYYPAKGATASAPQAAAAPAPAAPILLRRCCCSADLRYSCPAAQLPRCRARSASRLLLLLRRRRAAACPGASAAQARQAVSVLFIDEHDRCMCR